jgi:hypothetical protein
LRIPLVRGRALAERDGKDTPRAAVISSSMSSRYCPTEDPLGARVKLGSSGNESPWVTIVGVVGDVKQNWWDPQPRPTIYLPYAQAPRRRMDVLVRARDPLSIVAGVRAAIGRVDPEQAIQSVEPMEKTVGDALAPVRIIGMLMVVFGALSLVLSVVGVYSVLSYYVAERRHEFGVRMALGAGPGDVFKLVLKQTMKLAGIGLAVALPASFLLGGALSSLLVGVVSMDSATYAAITVLLLLMSLAAGHFPARRAARRDPMAALRQE